MNDHDSANLNELSTLAEASVQRALDARQEITSLSAEHLEEVEAFLAAIDGNDDVQNVYVGLAG